LACSATGPAINRDWENRQFTEEIQHNVLKITEFLNKFGASESVSDPCSCLVTKACDADNSTRYRLAKLNDKLSSLESHLE
jgi:hypothetical protein